MDFRLGCRLVCALLVTVSFAGWAVSASAGTLEKLRRGEPLVIGYVDQNLPFSVSTDNPDAPGGFTIDICRLTVDHLKDSLQLSGIAVEYRVVTFDTRFSALDSNEIDLECAATTVTRSRMENYRFTPSYYVTGVRMLVAKGSDIQSLDQLARQPVAIVGNTTGEALVRQQDELASLQLDLKPYDSTEAAVAATVDGEVQAFPFDEILLYAFMAARPKGAEELDVVGRFLSIEPYGLMMRLNDTAFEQAVSESLREVLASRDAVDAYDRWFRNDHLNAPMNRLTKEVFAMPSRDPAFP